MKSVTIMCLWLSLGHFVCAMNGMVVCEALPYDQMICQAAQALVNQEVGIDELSNRFVAVQRVLRSAVVLSPEHGEALTILAILVCEGSIVAMGLGPIVVELATSYSQFKGKKNLSKDEDYACFSAFAVLEQLMYCSEGKLFDDTCKILHDAVFNSLKRDDADNEAVNAHLYPYAIAMQAATKWAKKNKNSGIKKNKYLEKLVVLLAHHCRYEDVLYEQTIDIAAVRNSKFLRSIRRKDLNQPCFCILM